MQLMQRVKIAHSFSVCVKSVPRYHFKLAYKLLHIVVKEFFGEIDGFNRSLVIDSF